MVFVDSSALYAIANREEEPHSRAAEAWRRLLADQAVLLTTNYVLLETSALVQRRLGMEALRDFETSVVPLLHVEWVDEERQSIRRPGRAVSQSEEAESGGLRELPGHARNWNPDRVLLRRALSGARVRRHPLIRIPGSRA